MIDIVALLATALLFGGMTLYSFGFAPLVFSALPPDVAGKLLRQAFPHYYLFVLVMAALAGLTLWPRDSLASALMVATALIAIVARQMLMPAINTARDAGAKSWFNALHGLSVGLNMVQLMMVVAVLVRLA
jgi:ABC-type transport system involved in multi-copper enzyme maturation permease subunit